MDIINDYYMILAALSAGFAVMSLSLLVFDLVQKVEVDRMEEQEDAKSLPIFFRLFMPLVPNVLPLAKSDALAPTRNKTNELIQMAGYDQAITSEQFIGVRILMAVFGVIFMLLLTAGKQPMMGMLLLFVCFLYPTVWIRKVVRLRHLQILKALPNVLDLLTLSVEAGKDFLTALRDIMGRRKVDALGEELKRALHEIQLGKQRQRALKEMALRVQHPELTSIVNAIIQADELGVSIGQLLRIQGDQLRSKRFSRAEKLANEAPVKILMPVVLFIFPSVFIILMGPILLQALNSIAR